MIEANATDKPVLKINVNSLQSSKNPTINDPQCTMSNLYGIKINNYIMIFR
jgi:hypothetical protein